MNYTTSFGHRNSSSRHGAGHFSVFLLLPIVQNVKWSVKKLCIHLCESFSVGI